MGAGQRVGGWLLDSGWCWVLAASGCCGSGWALATDQTEAAAAQSAAAAARTKQQRSNPAPPIPPARLPARLQAKFRVNQHCKVLCRIGSLNKAQEKAFKSRISDEYRVNM